MQVEDSTLEKAVFGVFRDQQLVAQQGLAFSDLQDSWYQTGLRTDDLRDAVRVLLEQEFITIDSRDGGMLLTLTQQGAQRATQFGIRLSRLRTDLRDTVTLLRARRRRSPGANAEAAQQRRQSDAA